MPKPRAGERHDDFISRCMGSDEAQRDFPDQDQRYAFCSSQWERRHKAKDDRGVGFSPVDFTFVSGDGTFEGYASVFGVEDFQGEVVAPGAFTEAIERRGLRGIRMLYQHDADRPVGAWELIEEDDQGLHVRGKLALNTELGREVKALMEAGAIDGLSIGYIVEQQDGENLLKLDIFEISVVSFPATPGARVDAEDGLRPYRSVGDLPQHVKRLLPRDAQRVYRAKFNQYVEQNPDRPARQAHAAAWRAVRKEWHAPEKEASMWVKRLRDSAGNERIQMVDEVVYDALRRTSDGYLAASVKVARTGIQLYRGADFGRPDMDEVRVYRPESEVFNKDALHSFAHRPVTVNHPPEMVSDKNWRDYSVGQTGDEVARDGDYIRVPMLLCDAAAIQQVAAGHKQLSMGYTCDIDFTPGVTPKGEHYDAVQTGIRANHLAIVAAARGGPELRIGDGTEETIDMNEKLKTVMVDGQEIQVVGDLAGNVVARAIASMEKTIASLKKKSEEEEEEFKKAKKDAADAAAAHAKAIEAKDAEIAVLKKSVEDAALKPEQIDALVKDRAAVIDRGKAILGDKLVVDGKSDSEIRRQCVDAKLGETAKGWSDDKVEAAFAAIQVDGTQQRGAHRDTLSSALSNPPAQDDRAKAYDENVDRIGNAWRKPAA